MTNLSNTKTIVGRHVAAAGIVVATVVLLAVLRILGVAPGWFIGVVVVFNVLLVLAILMHVTGEGGPVRSIAAFTVFLLVALGVLTWYSERGGYEGEHAHGFITGDVDASDTPFDVQAEE